MDAEGNTKGTCWCDADVLVAAGVAAALAAAKGLMPREVESGTIRTELTRRGVAL